MRGGTVMANSRKIRGDPIIDILIEEYKLLREETLQKFQHQIQLFTILASALSLLIGYILIKGIYDVFYIIPIFVIPLIFRYIWEQVVVTTMGRYMREELIEKRLAEVIGKRNNAQYTYDQHWLGWEHYYLDWEKERYKKIGIPRYFDYAAMFIFIILPFGLPICYSFLHILISIGITNINLTTYLPSWTHVSIFFIYVFIAIYLSYRIRNDGIKVLKFEEKEHVSSKKGE